MSKTWITGRVIPGYKRARHDGYPTANMHVVDTAVLPEKGVYAAWADYLGKIFPAAAVVGVEPGKCEVHLLDWSGDLYNQTLGILIVRRVSDIAFFSGSDIMIAKIERDISQIRRILGPEKRPDS